MERYRFTKDDARRGGVASGEARRNKRSLKETAEILLKTALPEEIKAEMAAKGFPCETFQDALVAAVIESAKGGNAAMFANIMKLVGEGVERVEVENVDYSLAAMEAWVEETRREFNQSRNTASE